MVFRQLLIVFLVSGEIVTVFVSEVIGFVCGDELKAEAWMICAALFFIFFVFGSLVFFGEVFVVWVIISGGFVFVDNNAVREEACFCVRVFEMRFNKFGDVFVGEE